jgi:OmpA-OmpF porin, OOP family
MTVRRIAALVLGASLIASAAQAQWMGGTPYLSLDGGWNHMSDLSFKGSTTNLNASTQESEGYLVGGAAGLAFDPFRVELGLDYRNNSVNSIHFGTAGAFPAVTSGSASGDVHSIAGMVRGYYDLPFGAGPLKPYIGAGVGLVSISLSGVKDAAGHAIVSDSDTEPGLEALAGLRYELNKTWSAALQYQFLNAWSPRFKDQTGARFSTNDYRNNSIVLRITYSFAPPPPPPPTPAAAPAPVPPAAPAAAVPGPRQLFIVFFDFDKSTITEAGQKVLDEAAVAFQANRPVRIEVTGYTDTVGTVQYNLGLSKRRADAVRDYLAKKGVPADRMDVAWKGKSDLRVPTPDGVREPQNRRVEIIFP